MRAGVRDLLQSLPLQRTSHYPHPISFRIPAQSPTMPAEEKSLFSPHCGDWNWGRTGSDEVGSDEPSNYADACERDRAELESIGSLQDRINVPRLTEGGRKEGLIGHVEG